MTDSSLLLRMDAGHDSVVNLAICQAKGVHFIIKRNLRKETPEIWHAVAQDDGHCEKLRKGQRRYRGRLEVSFPSLSKPVYQVFEVIETTMTKVDQLMAIPDIQVDVYWTDLEEDEETIIALYLTMLFGNSFIVN